MKIFIYKTLFVFFCLYVLLEISIGNKIRKFEKEMHKVYSKENLLKIKSKIKEEMQDAIDKDVYLSPEDAKLIGQYLEKIQSEINLQK
tara:strand:+ start:490 stop:753 length:264 start_codon:yes stop_codon:yes gene_type:complete